MSAPLAEFFHELGFVLLEHRGEGRFALLSTATLWLTELWGVQQTGPTEILVAEKSLFLENFLLEADAFWASNRGGLCQSETWTEKSPTGAEVPLQAIALVLQGKRFLALHSPEPQFRERVQLLQTARNSLLDHEKLQREIQKKEILLHCIIHDLSQPLSVMSVALDCMREEGVSDRGKDVLELGRRASDQQLSMIRDILQVFSADLKASQESENQVESPDLLLCARSVLNAFTPVFAAKNVRLWLDERIDLPGNWQVRGETSRIGRIFSNLLENALRYTPSGSRVTIGLESDGEFVKAFVDDEGPGLPADLSPTQIFALLSKGKEGSGKAGLGLYFCRLTVERWGGTIGCASLPEKGSRFWFRLPKSLPKPGTAERKSEMPAVTRSAAPLSAKKYPMRILLADDQNEIRLLTTHQLERSGHYVVAVANGQQVLDALDREPFDAVLLDEEMPVLSGLQALRVIRERKQAYGPLVVIALTGNNTDSDRDRLLLAGFDSVIGKPFRLESLDALFPQSPVEPQLEKKEVVSEAAQTPAENLLDRVGGDEKLARKMIATFLSDAPKRLAGIEQSLKQKDGETLASLAHALKGSVSIFGAKAARDHSQKLHELGHARDFQGITPVFEQLKEEIAELEANLRGYAGRGSSARPGARSKSKQRTAGPKRKRP